MLGLIAKEILGENTASGNLAERERFELAVRVLIQRLRGDSVAILEKQKAAPKGGFSI